MATKDNIRWLVVVKPVPPKLTTRDTFGTSNYVMPPPVEIREVNAPNAKAAAEMANPQAGALVYVAKMSNVTKLKRPEKAELVAA